MNQASLALCLALATVFATTTITSAAPLTINQSPCCPPDQFNGTMFQDTISFGGIGYGFGKSVYHFNFDYKNQRLSMRNASKDGNYSRVIIFPKIAYVIDEKVKTCRKTYDTPFPNKVCVPRQADNLGPSHYGSLNATAYAYYDTANKASMLITVADDSCIAVNLVETETKTKTKTSSFVSTTVFTNVQEAVDESELDLPAYCPRS